jgi:hypothetical protein
MPKIVYECRDIKVPSGGVRRLYRHVEVLVKHGYDAAIAHWTQGFRVPWFESPAPVLYWSEGLRLSPTDILVIPEGHADVIAGTAGAEYRRVVIALSWSFIYRDLKPGLDWRDFGITDIIAGSNYVQEFIKVAMGMDSSVIASGIDLSLFRPSKKVRQIACMPRKNRDVLHMIVCIFRSRFPEYADVPFVPIDGMRDVEVSSIMSSSDVFLATGFPEGLARPALEAMASGCIVVGFAGRGSREYMTDGVNCYVREDYDALGAAIDLGRALDALRSGQAAKMRAAARETAERYSLCVEESRLLRFWSQFLGRTPDASRKVQEKELHAS